MSLVILSSMVRVVLSRKVTLYLSICLFKKMFFVFGCTHSLWDLSSLTGDQTCTPCIGSTES